MKAPTALILFKIHRLQPGTSVVKENLFKWKSPNYTPSIPPFLVLAVMRDWAEGLQGLDFGKSWVVSTGSWASLNWTGSITGNKSRFGLFFSFFLSKNFQNFSLLVEVLAGSVRIWWCGQQGWAAGLVSGDRTKLRVCKPLKPPGETRTGLNFYKEVSTATALCFPRTCGQCPFSLLHICKGEEGKE